MKLAEREENILDFVIRNYVRSASPVSSNRVFGGLKLDVSTATIRNAMLELDEEGFLEQPHTSAGRVPTDKAYRYFVDHLMDHDNSLGGDLKLFTGVISFGRKARVESFGLSEVLKEPEFSEHELTVKLARLVDNLTNLAEAYFERTPEEECEIFIGEENPVKEAYPFSVFSLRFENIKRGEGVVFSVGPKRMDYENTLRVYNLWKKKF